jgi:pimeloyl-ACP methyl ester carboxylesterase
LNDEGGQLGIAGRAFAWRTLGSGQPLLLVNGYAATAADWDPTFLAGLAEGFKVIHPDNRGLGGSELGAAAELTVDSMAADLEALLDELAIEGLPVVGWSMGGFVAQRLATRAPGRVTALGLLATDPGGEQAVRAEPAVLDRLTGGPAGAGGGDGRLALGGAGAAGIAAANPGSARRAGRRHPGAQRRCAGRPLGWRVRALPCHRPGRLI